MCDDIHPYVLLFDDLLAGPLADFNRLGSAIGGLVSTMSTKAVEAFTLQRRFLLIASKSKVPSQSVLMDLLKPMADSIGGIQSFREANRRSEFFNHLSTISESIGALSWVTITPTPGPYVKEMKDSAQFYVNKVLVSYKDKDKTHTDWVKSWIEFLSQLQAYIKANHTTGLVWNNNRGGDAVTVAASVNGSGSRAPPPPPPGGPPPPPPPPSMDIYGEQKKGDDSRLQLLASLSMGTDITKSLKHVAKDQMTHKNPNLRVSSVVTADAIKGSATNGGSKAPVVVAKPPKFELEGKKWMVEFMTGRQDIVIQEVEMNQSVNLYKCKDTVVQVKGKCNNICIDSCIKTAIVFEDIVSVVEFINCQSVQCQSMSKVPTINIEKTDGAQIFLSKDSVTCEIVTAKCSAINVSVPDPKTGDFVEHPIPEQFKSIFNGKLFVTEAADKSA